ncbi:hypothetical protein AR685_16580 [Chryseobacterium sp. JAH]|nr:hypothetical protein AR685_16580 [Chryseobacterium sp. JAH]
MAEQMTGVYDNPYKFNAKELDSDTGLYYYGARYYNPRLSVWYGVDPLAGKYPNLSPYVYTANNPIKYIDPDGRRIIIWTKRGDGSYTKIEYSYKKNRNYKELSYGYERNAMKLLDQMYEAGVNTDFIDKASSSKKDFNIIKPTMEGRNRYRNMIGLYEGKKNPSEMQHVDPENSIGTMFWDDEAAIDIKDVGGGKKGSLSPAGAGLHEINHGEEAFFNPVAHQTNTEVDKETGEPVVKPPKGFPNQEEYRNTTETNVEAKKMKLPDAERTIYGEGTSRKVNGIIKN